MNAIKSTRQSTIDTVAGNVNVSDIDIIDVTIARNEIRNDTHSTARGYLRVAEECYTNDKGYSNRVALIAARIEAR